jgi:hypothetical protein
VLGGELPAFEDRVLQVTPKEIVDFINDCLAFEADKRPTFKEAGDRLRVIYDNCKK